MRNLLIEKAREAEELAEQSMDGSATQEGWLSVAQSWRLLADRIFADQTGEEDIVIRVLH